MHRSTLRGPCCKSQYQGCSTPPSPRKGMKYRAIDLRERIARIANRAGSLLQGNQPADSLPVPNPSANTVPADNRRDASASRVQTPDADFTIEELQQDQVFSVPTSSIDGIGRVVAYQKIGFGRSVKVATGPNRFCKYRIRPARDYGIGRNKTDIPLVTPRPDAHGRGFALAGKASQDKGDLGPAVLNRGLREMPRTYIKGKWDDGGPDTWETRTILRQLMGKAVADQAIYDCASKFELDAQLFMENHPGWGQGDLVTVNREPEGPGSQHHGVYMCCGDTRSIRVLEFVRYYGYYPHSETPQRSLCLPQGKDTGCLIAMPSKYAAWPRMMASPIYYDML
ncbi:hypothetical protein C7212DRAFT_343053 [Tuber magnatum]|uniref:Uncharacterized protein n=1 Tax=Tuber magnatum TaxID=42249 RepID=A0A317SSB8_9PEZI|nr:hypothetical protein C7212DRAFT_343053 [Tuber magnatum]